MNKPAKIYRRGKKIKTSSSEPSNSESEEEESEEQKQAKQTKQTIKTTIISIQSDSIVQKQAEHSKNQTSTSSPSNHNHVIDPSESSSSSSVTSSDDQEETSDDESESEVEKLVPIYKPVFISKKDRQTIPNPNQSEPNETDQGTQQLCEQQEEEISRRKLSSKKLVEQTLIRELSEKEVGQVFPDVDDTDGINVEAEFESWKLRELTRLKRDREALIQRAKEKEEIEARRAIPESQRFKQDLEFAEQTRKSKTKTKQAFLQKYHHKGAFYNDSEILKKHDYTAPTEGTFTKMELLPTVMQVRDFGKMSRSKWTHLAKEDTTSLDAGWYQNSIKQGKNMKSGCFKCGENGHIQKDCPKNLTSASFKGSVGVGRGANQVQIGKRRTTDDDSASLKRREDVSYASKRREETFDHGKQPSRPFDRRGSRHDEDGNTRFGDRYGTRDVDSYVPHHRRRRGDDSSNRSRKRDRSPSPRTNDRDRRG